MAIDPNRSALEILRGLGEDRIAREKKSEAEYQKRKAKRDIEVADILNRAKAAVEEAEKVNTESKTLTARDLINSKKGEGAEKVAAASNSKSDGEGQVSIEASLVGVRQAKKLETNIDKLTKRFLVLFSIVEDIKKVIQSDADDAKKIARITSIVQAEGNAYKLEEATSEEKPSISSAIGNVATATEKAVPGVAAFALALPFLFSPEVRDMLFGFFQGFLKGLGLSDTALAIAKPVLGAAIGILGAVFTINALSPVVTLFEHMTKLVNLVQLAAQAVVMKSEMADAKISELRLKRLKTLKRLKNLKRVKTFLLNASKLLKTSLVAAAAGVAIDVVGGTLLDVVTADPETEISPMNIIKMAINNLVESVTLGLVKGPFELDQKDPDEVAAEVDKKKENKPSKPTSSPPTNAPVPPAAAVLEKESPTKSTPADVSTATASAAPDTKPSTPSADVSPSQSAPPAAAASVEVKNGAVITGLSENVAAAETDMKKDVGNSILVVNNNNTVVTYPEENNQSSGGAAYSADVGR